MPSFTIKVPNHDGGEDLGTYESNYLPRVGDPFVLWHPRVCPKKDEKDEPFCGIVSGVTHEATHGSHPYAKGINRPVETFVWLAEEHGAPALFCDCTEEERARHGVTDGACENCGHTRKT